MSDIAGQLARVRGAFGQPTLTLLHQRQAPVIIAVFRTSFGRDARTVPAARLHDQVDTYLTELRHAGITDLPTGTGRDLCLRWMRGRWLVRTTDDEGTEVYALTSHAQDALNLVKSLTRERASLSEHRITTILNAVRRFNTEVNPDREARVSILDAEIARLSEERDRLCSGGELAQPSAEYLLEGFGELLALVGGLPSDFARVEESFARLRGEVLASFRAENRPAGEVVDQYLQQADHVMTATAEGRAFEGAVTLLRDDGLLLQLREDLGALLEHPMAGTILNDADRRELHGTVALIRRGLDEVLAQRNRVTATLREYIVTHDADHDRELDATLRAVDAELATWMRSAGPRAVVDLPLLPPRVDVNHLRERFHDPEGDTAPPGLNDVSDQRPVDLSLHQLLAQGGPSMGSLRDALAGALTSAAPLESLGVLFDSLDPALRRPVEIFGLLQLATNGAGLARHGDTEVYAAVRPDGSPRDLAVPRLTPVPSTPEPAAGRPQEPR